LTFAITQEEKRTHDRQMKWFQ